MPQMPVRKLGKSGLTGSALGFGCMSLTPGFYGHDMDVNETEKVLRRALDLGCDVLNTADFYGNGDRANIKLIGKVLKDYPRQNVKLTCKWGPWMGDGKFTPLPEPNDCKRRVTEALKVLGTDYIDVLVLRLPGPTADVPTLDAMAKEMKAVLDEGMVKAVGVSEGSADHIRSIHAIVPVSLIELEWSLFTRESEKEIIPYAREIGAGFLAYSPLGRGMLTGKLNLDELSSTDFRRTMNPRFKQDAYDNNIKLVKKVEELAEKKGCTSGQLALAWVLAQGDDVIPIPGTKRIKYLEENLGALEVKLSPEEVQELRDIVPEDAVAGSRY